MHGLGMADALLHKVEGQSAQNPGKVVLEVRVKVGRFMFADLSELTSAWELIVRDTPLRDAKLSLELVDGRDCVLSGVVYEE